MTAPSYKPDGYSTVSPYLIVSDANASIEFMRTVFDAVELRRFPDESGQLRHAEVRLDDIVIMVADATPDWPPSSTHLHVYVPDVDAAYKRALDAGAVSLQKPAQRGDEDKRGGVKDSSGTSWWVATRVG